MIGSAVLCIIKGIHFTYYNSKKRLAQNIGKLLDGDEFVTPTDDQFNHDMREPLNSELSNNRLANPLLLLSTLRNDVPLESEGNSRETYKQPSNQGGSYSDY
jgi:hypothetical protein